jgi:hypothetical protein
MTGSYLELTNIQREDLCLALTSAFPTRSALARLVNFELDVDLENVAGGETYPDVVFQLVRWAVAQGKVEVLVKGARGKNPGNPSLRAFEEQFQQPPEKHQEATPAPVEILQAGRVGPIIHPPWSLNGVDRFAFVDVGGVSNWFIHLRQAAAAVCRLELHDGVCSGFLVGQDLLLTCYNILEPLLNKGQYENPVTGKRTSLSPEGIVIRFGFSRGLDGLQRPGYVYHLAADWLIDCSPSEALNYVLLRVDGAPGTDRVDDDINIGARKWLQPVKAYEFQENQPLYVLQHPRGGPLQVSYATGAQLNDQRSRFEYQTLTEPGSSGSPCLSDTWELVGMHESRQFKPNGQATLRQGIPMAAIIAQPKVQAALE